MRAACVPLIGVLIAVASTVACSSASTPTTPTPSAAEPSISETFVSTLPVNDSRFYSFSFATYGTVNATLVSMSGEGVPPGVVVNLGIGRPSGTGCSGSQSQVQATGWADLTAVVSTTDQPGVYCVIISDFGNLFAPANFVVRIDHP